MLNSLLTINIPLDPNLFDIGGLEVTWHGLLSALGVVTGVVVAAFFARRAGFPEDTIYNIALALVIGGIIGARGLFVIEHWDRFEDDLGDIFSINAGGISVYGAYIGGILAATAYAFWRRVPNKWKAADIAGLGAIFGQAVGRIGDLINGEHWSEPTSLPWAVRYTDADSTGRLNPFGPDVAVHPAVAYELLGDLAVFLVLLLVYRLSRRSGLTFMAWVFLYGGLRLGVGFLRLDDIAWAGLRTHQIVAIVTMVMALAGAIYLAVSSPPTGPTRAERRRLARAERRRLSRPGGS